MLFGELGETPDIGNHDRGGEALATAGLDALFHAAADSGKDIF